MKLAFSANAFRKYSLEETIGIIASKGYEGIEIMADAPHAFPPHLTESDITAIRRTLDRHRIAISNINAFMLHAIGDTWRPSWIEQDPAEREKRVRHTLDCIDLAHKLDAPTISTEPGGPLDGMGRDDAQAIFLEGLEKIRERALEKNVRVLIEPEPELLVENSTQFKELFSRLNPMAFGLNFDIGHFYCVGEDPAVLVSELKDSTAHFHLEDIASNRVHHHLMPGDGSIDLKRVLDEIRGIGYEGFVTVELYPYEDRPVEAAEKAIGYLRGLL